MTETEAKAVRTPAGTEVWETTIDGAVWVRVLDQRGNERNVQVGPLKGARLRIKTPDRENTEDSILNEDSNPFANGTLRRVDNLPPEHSPVQDLETHAYTDEALGVAMSLSGKEFEKTVDEMNERGVRSLKAYALLHDGTLNQLAYVQQVIDEKYKIEAVMPSTKELIDADMRGEEDF